jgi:hypothetical protein
LLSSLGGRKSAHWDDVKVTYGNLHGKTRRRTMDHPQAAVKCLLLMMSSLGICSLNLPAQQGTDTSQPETHGGEGAPTPTTNQPVFTSPGTVPTIQPSPGPGTSNAKGNPGSSNQTQNGGKPRDRLFFTLPNFLTVENAGRVPPLTAAEKFNLTARSSFDYVELLWYGAVAGVSQAENQESHYGQGAEGYAKRYAAHFADGTIENFTTTAIFPSLLHQDPRYYQLGKGSFLHRSGYAVSRIFVTKADSGHRQVNYSEIGGSFTASAISTYSYYPRGDRNVPNVLSLWGTQMGYDALTLVMREFWPDLRRKLHRSNATKSP